MDLMEIDRVKKELTAFIEGFKDRLIRKERAKALVPSLHKWAIVGWRT